jgi:hypothetical protein
MAKLTKLELHKAAKAGKAFHIRKLTNDPVVAGIDAEEACPFPVGDPQRDAWMSGYERPAEVEA